jgi:ubiquinone biosynthesis protein UbiJ
VSDPAQDGAEPGEDAWDLLTLGQDWLTIWHSEIAAIAVDRELRETWQGALAAWFGAAEAALRALRPAPSDGSAGRAGSPSDLAARAPARADAAAGPAAAAAASDAGRDELERLRGRVAGLEQRLAELECRPRRSSRRRVRP